MDDVPYAVLKTRYSERIEGDEVFMFKSTPMRKIKEVILHCTATPEGKNFKAADIDRWHKAKGWKGIGYNAVIDIDGTVEQGRPVEQIPAHCTGHNANSIGIVYVGGLAKDGKTPKDTRTQAQRDSLLNYVYLVLQQYGLTLEQVHCHNEYAVKACPCFSIQEFRKEYKEAFK